MLEPAKHAQVAVPAGVVADLGAWRTDRNGAMAQEVAEEEAAAAAATAAAAAGVGGGGAMGGAAARSTGCHCGGWATPRSSEGSVFERRWPMACPCADSSVRLAKGAATPMRTRLRKLRDCLAWSFGGQV